ncbi:hypothetical protein OIV83_001629 [Microbotryomycetes sp. JL201]|nr:hypothetical protein OIV83_001629 [Microbotryomycetes sp. JL201]
MVWVVTGTLKNRPDDPALSKPDETSHLLRPCRQYRVGRMGGVVIKQGQPPTLPRPIDFAVKANQVSKSGWCDWHTGGDDWNAIDSPESPSNLAPYTLTIICGQHLDLIRKGVRSRQEAGTSFEAQSGDKIQGTSALAPVLEAQFLWYPQVFSLSSAARFDELVQAAKPLGFKVAKGGHKPHHSHWIASKVQATRSVMSALMRCSNVADYGLVDELVRLAHVDSSTPHLQQLFGIQTEQELQELFQQPEKAYLPQILAAKVDIGLDWKRYWGHSMLEQDFSLFPRSSNWLPQLELNLGFDVGPSMLEPSPARKTLFAGLLFVSYAPTADTMLEPIIGAGAGKYLKSALKESDAAVSSLTVEIEQYLERHSTPLQAMKLVMIASDNIKFKHEPGEAEFARVLREVARRVGVHKYITSTDVVESVLRVDTSNLFGKPEPVTQLQIAELSAPAFDVPTSSGIPGTHPEDTLRNPDFYARNGAETQNLAVAGTTQSTAPYRKPTRRPAPGLRKRGFDALSSDDEDRPPTKTAISSIEVQSSAVLPAAVPSSSAPTEGTQARTQARRPGRGKRTASLLSSDEDGHDQGTTDGTCGGRSKHTREDPHARRLRLEAEDEAAAAANRALAKERAKQGLPVLQEAEELSVASGPSTRSRKRLASVALSEDEDALPVVASTRSKRTRSKSAQPVEPTPEPVAAPIPVRVSASINKNSQRTAEKRAEDVHRKQEEAALRAENQNLLQIKTTKRKMKDGQLNADLNAEFNKLKIVKPILLQMKPPTRHRMTWDEDDPDADMNRLIAEDQRRMQEGSDEDDHPDHWGGPSTQAFNVELVSLPKSVLNGRARPAAHRRDVQLVADETMDFGLGAEYKENRKQAMLVDDDNDEEEEDEEEEGDPDLRIGGSRQTKLTFASKSTAQKKTAATVTKPGKSATRASAKGKGKQVTKSDSEEDELEDDSESDTLGRSKDEDEMDVDSNASSKKGNRVSARSKATGTKSKTQRAPALTAKRKAGTHAMLVLSDSDDEDNGLTFRGFGATARR